MPFEVDSIFVDSIPVMLDDSLKHFWIYEFTAEGSNGEAIFRPALELRSGTPYIIAADSTMAGRSIVFRSIGSIPFFKTGSDKMLVTSPSFKFHGNTLAPKLKGIYVLNEDGTAFEYTSVMKTLEAMAPYFTTTLDESTAPASIVLPDIPVSLDVEDPTGIVPPFIATEEKGAIYNLSGQRLQKMQKGINIVNGKKIFIR